MLKHINENEFSKEVLESNKVVLVDFYATWCMPCKMLSPVLESLANSKTEIDICKVDIDGAEALANEYGIMVVPTLIVFKDGKEVERFSGYKSEEEINEIINPYI